MPMEYQQGPPHFTLRGWGFRCFLLLAVLVVATLMLGDGFRLSDKKIEQVKAKVKQESNNTSSSSSTMCSFTNRCQVLDTSRRFSFYHISKTGGSSWIHELKRLQLNLYPTHPAGEEFSVIHQNKLDVYDHLSYHMTSFRSPRHHVWSLWSECRFDRWGIMTTTGTGFPRSGKNSEEDVVDFTAWIHHFVNSSGHTIRNDTVRDSFRCYHPSNYQSRPLVVEQKNPHGPGGVEFLEPNLDIAKQAYWYMDWVAITDFFHESKCLLYSRLQPQTHNEYIESSCHCDTNTTVNAFNNKNEIDAQILHHNGRRREGMRDLPESLLADIATITKIDVELYKLALFQFLEEIHDLEGKLHRRVLCDSVLEKWEPELAYLNLSLKGLYFGNSSMNL